MHTGTLYVVATPIGNLADLSQRAIATLTKANLIVAEDTRHSKKLLQHLGLATPIRSLHEYNEYQRIPELLKLLKEGRDIALISDAGTPLISDPGNHLVYAAQDCNIPVVPIPGPCAAIAALSAGGLTADRFVFEGFLPSQANARRARLQELVTEARTLVFYEAPHRIEAMLTDLLSVFGNERKAVVAKELTKLFETIYRASLTELVNWLKQDSNRCKGEFVILVEGAKQIPATAQKTLDAEQLLKILLAELPLKQAVKIAAQLTDLKKNTLYDLALAQSDKK